jgi:transposase InsO family protein
MQNAKKFFTHLATPHPITRQNEVWSIEVVRLDTLDRPFVLIALDVFSRRPMVIDLTSETVADIATKLDDAVRRLGHPSKIWLDDSLEFRSQELEKWAVQHGIEIVYGATFRKSGIARRPLNDLLIFLSDKSFSTPEELKRDLDEWRQHYKAAA